jgi:hypothetical protein
MGKAAALGFMALVTCYLLVLVFSRATEGGGAGVEIGVYALSAAFGLEFLYGGWRSLWDRNVR